MSRNLRYRQIVFKARHRVRGREIKPTWGSEMKQVIGATLASFKFSKRNLRQVEIFFLKLTGGCRCCPRISQVPMERREESLTKRQMSLRSSANRKTKVEAVKETGVPSGRRGFYLPDLPVPSNLSLSLGPILSTTVAMQMVLTTALGSGTSNFIPISNRFSTTSADCLKQASGAGGNRLLLLLVVVPAPSPPSAMTTDSRERDPLGRFDDRDWDFVWEVVGLEKECASVKTE